VAADDLAPGHEHRDGLGDFHHRAHHVLDHDDCDALLLQAGEEREDVVDLGGGGPGHGLVGNEELGLGRHGARELELSHVHLGEAARHCVRASCETHLPEDAHRFLDDPAGRELLVLARGIEERYAQIVEHRHAGEGLGNLEAAREAHADAPVRGMPADVLSLEADAPFLVLERPGDAIDERALARAVRPDETDALAGPHDEVDALQRREAAEALRDAFDFEKGCGHHLPFPRRQASTQPMMPFGASVTKSTSSTPTMSRFHAPRENITCTSCCTLPSSTAPMSGPIQLIVPPISGMAMLFTA